MALTFVAEGVYMDAMFEKIRNGLVRPSRIPDGSGFSITGWILVVLGFVIALLGGLPWMSIGGGLVSLGLALIVIGHFTKLFRHLDNRLLEIQVGMLGERGHLESERPPVRSLPPRSTDQECSGADD